jgi:hypothetical protein
MWQMARKGFEMNYIKGSLTPALPMNRKGELVGTASSPQPSPPVEEREKTPVPRRFMVPMRGRGPSRPPMNRQG